MSEPELEFRVAIPARYASTRLPGKPLRLLAGRPLIEHVYRRARASGALEVVIATDDARIREVAEGFGATVCMTAPEHPSGTDRLAEVATRLGWLDDAIVVNVQGDEPGMPPALIQQVALSVATHPDAGIATACACIHAPAELFDLNAVKVVCDAQGYALYFSRAPIPWARDAFAADRSRLPAPSAWLRHIGIYAYRAGFLQAFAQMPPGTLERIESLEQLRVLEAGHRIAVALAPEPFPPGVDTLEDLERAQARLDGVSR